MIITLTTDFGADSPYVAQMKAAILRINPSANIVDICHSIPPQDIRQGALVLADCAKHFPDRTIHVAVIDPGVGSSRDIVYARIGNQDFVAPDNGLLSYLVRDNKPSLVIAVREHAYWNADVSHTFHGRDIMAPVAAHLGSGVPPASLGPKLETIHRLSCEEIKIEPNRMRGSIVRIDSFGNLISNIGRADLSRIPSGASFRVVCSQRETHSIATHYAAGAQGELIALVGSNGFLELAIVQGRASEQLRVQAGEPIEIQWSTEQ